MQGMGESFGDYELLKKIATGGMAEIFLARLNSADGFGRPVVVKRMLPQLAVRQDFVTMFLDEARLAANLGHPNVVQVFNLGEHDGAYFMAMELIDGPHLGALFAHSLRQRKPLPVEFCAFAVARAADGLDYAHNRIDPATGHALNIVHRDISPQNILVSRHGDVKVTDFGVAKAETQEAKTRTGIIKGKVSYMSPEQCLGEKVDRRTDVFALGIVLYELLTRRRLFRDKSDLLVMQRITNEKVKPPSTLNPALDADLDAIAEKALARDRSERYQSAAELSEALDYWMAKSGFGNAKRKLAGWIADNAPGLGLHVDTELSESRKNFVSPGAPTSKSGPAPVVLEEADAVESPGGTVSTPALEAVANPTGLPDRSRLDLSDEDDDATMVAVEPPAQLPSDSSTEIGAPLFSGGPTLDDGRAESGNSGPHLSEVPPAGPTPAQLAQLDSDETSPLSPMSPLEDTLHHEPAPGERRRPLPMAALGGGVAAIVVGLAAGFFLMKDDASPTVGMAAVSDAGGEVAGSDEDARGVGRQKGEKSDDAPRKTGVGKPSDDDPKDDATGSQKLAGTGQENGQKKPGDDPGGATKPGEGDVAVAPAKVTIDVKTDPAGVPVRIGNKVQLSPHAFELLASDVKGGRTEVTANFNSGAVKRTVRIKKGAGAVRIVEKVDLSVRIDPKGAKWTLRGGKVNLDGAGSEKRRAVLLPGTSYDFTASLNGYEKTEQTLVPVAGKMLVIDARLKKKKKSRSPPPPKGEGTLVLYSAPEVQVKIAGRSYKHQPVLRKAVRTGRHRLSLSNPNLGISKSFTVHIDKGKTTTVKVRWKHEGGGWKLTKSEVGRPR